MPWLLLLLGGCRGEGTAATAPASAAGAGPEGVLNVDLGGGVLLPMRRIPAGEFEAGSGPDEVGRRGDEARHRVRLTRAFYIGVTEITQAQWRAVDGGNPSYLWGPARPVEHVSWRDAEGFCRALSKKTGRRFALPTEAQWEYACRAGQAGAFCCGNDPARLVEYAWCQENATPAKTRPVATRKPNAWGLHDMHGNVREWCADWYGPFSGETLTDPSGPAAGTMKVLRGGSWGYVSGLCRSAAREAADPAARDAYAGFRVVMDSP